MDLNQQGRGEERDIVYISAMTYPGTDYVREIGAIKVSSAGKLVADKLFADGAEGPVSAQGPALATFLDNCDIICHGADSVEPAFKLAYPDGSRPARVADISTIAARELPDDAERSELYGIIGLGAADNASDDAKACMKLFYYLKAYHNVAPASVWEQASEPIVEEPESETAGISFETSVKDAETPHITEEAHLDIPVAQPVQAVSEPLVHEIETAMDTHADAEDAGDDFFSDDEEFGTRQTLEFEPVPPSVIYEKTSNEVEIESEDEESTEDDVIGDEFSSLIADLDDEGGAVEPEEPRDGLGAWASATVSSFGMKKDAVKEFAEERADAASEAVSDIREDAGSAVAEAKDFISDKLGLFHNDENAEPVASNEDDQFQIFSDEQQAEPVVSATAPNISWDDLAEGVDYYDESDLFEAEPLPEDDEDSEAGAVEQSSPVSPIDFFETVEEEEEPKPAGGSPVNVPKMTIGEETIAKEAEPVVDEFDRLAASIIDDEPDELEDEEPETAPFAVNTPTVQLPGITADMQEELEEPSGTSDDDESDGFSFFEEDASEDPAEETAGKTDTIAAPAPIISWGDEPESEPEPEPEPEQVSETVVVTEPEPADKDEEPAAPAIGWRSATAAVAPAAAAAVAPVAAAAAAIAPSLSIAGDEADKPAPEDPEQMIADEVVSAKPVEIASETEAESHVFESSPVTPVDNIAVEPFFSEHAPDPADEPAAKDMGKTVEDEGEWDGETVSAESLFADFKKLVDEKLSLIDDMIAKSAKEIQQAADELQERVGSGKMIKVVKTGAPAQTGGFATNDCPTKDAANKMKAFSKLPRQTERGVEDVNMDGEIIYTLAGTFKHSPKGQQPIKDYMASKGAKFSKDVTLQCDYLILGQLGSNLWKDGDYGTKVERAIELQKSGKSAIRIVDEDSVIGDDFWD